MQKTRTLIRVPVRYRLSMMQDHPLRFSPARRVVSDSADLAHKAIFFSL